MTARNTRQPAVASRWRLLVVAAVVAAGTALIAVGGLQGTTVYYLTPTEITSSPPRPTEPVRLGGLVKAGTVHSDGARVGFVLTDGSAEVSVVSAAALPQVFTEGEGAVVEGLLGADGVFRADRVMVRHSNEYRAP